MTQHAKDLTEKCIQMSAIFNSTYFNASGAKQGFVALFTPPICYSLATTSIKITTLKNIQKPVVCSVLSRKGYNQHMPRAVVFGSILKGGIGLLDLYLEQGAQQIKCLYCINNCNPIYTFPFKYY
jgi:hypothetical protein